MFRLLQFSWMQFFYLTESRMEMRQYQNIYGDGKISEKKNQLHIFQVLEMKQISFSFS